MTSTDALLTRSCRRWRTGIGLNILALFLPISAAPADVPIFEEGTDTVTVKAGLKILNESLKQISSAIKVTRCDVMIFSHPGHVETIIGGLCRLNTGASVILCGDTAMGDLGLTSSLSGANPSSKEELLSFTQANCHGG